MELRHIRYLIAAAEEEHFGRAAERLNVTRSAVSQIVSDLEAELGFALFERQAQKIRLTAAGRAMLPRLNALVSELLATVALGRRVGEGKSGYLRIGYGSLSTHHPVFRAAIKKFHEDVPDIALSLVEIPTSRQFKAMQDGVIQAGFMHAGPDPLPRESWSSDSLNEETGLQARVIDVAALGVIVPEGHRFAHQSSVRLVDLAGEPLVMTHNAPNTPLFRTFFRLCRDAGIEPRVVQEVSATGTQQDLVAAGVGVGVTAVGGRHHYPPQLRALPFDDIQYEVGFALTWLSGWVEPALQTFIDIVASVGEAPRT